jgi:hydroxyacylglutathione hydrolase
MFFRQVINEDLGCASYVIAGGGEAAVVDPQWEIDPYLSITGQHDLTIVCILETHNHADHVSGRGRLARATGAAIRIGGEAGVEYEHEPLADGDRIDLDGVRITALAAPGHRPEHVVYVVEDREQAERPWLVLTGDSLFVGDLARPDLAVDPDEGSRGLFRSLRRLLEFDDQVEVWPGHIGSSLCGGAGMSEKPSSTIGFERRLNRFCGIQEEQEFVDELKAGLGPQPPNFERVVALNRGPLLADRQPLEPLTPARVRERIDAGAVVVDSREPREFDGAHIPGSLSVTSVKLGVGTRAAWAVDPDTELVLVAETDGGAASLGRMLEAVGFRTLAGYLAGGIGAWRQAGEEVTTTPALDVEGLAERLREDEVVLLDVREADEWHAGHVEGSLHIPYHELRDGRHSTLETEGKPVAVACSGGIRSSLAASLLERGGLHDVEHVAEGGIQQLRRHGIELVED